MFDAQQLVFYTCGRTVHLSRFRRLHNAGDE
jgi:hypothetical protein